LIVLAASSGYTFVAMTGSDYVIIGGGIVGLATALALLERRSSATVTVLEKEQRWAAHQTGRNSGVIHSGIYYKPGSLKAQMARTGNAAMVRFCQEHKIPHDICGKVIVATRPEHLPLMEQLRLRGIANGLAVESLDSAQVQEIEPHVRCLGGLRVPSTGIVSYAQVCEKLVEMIRARGGDLRLGACVENLIPGGQRVRVVTSQGELSAGFIVNCAGLHSDRVARLGGARSPARIVPFRGEYYELRPEARHLVKSLIYPVPNPAFPFLGVHFTRMIDGSVHAGPNAVLAFKREGYYKTNFSLRDFAEVMLFPGFWRLAARNAGEGLNEMKRSLSKARFVRSLQELVPAVRAEDLVRSEAGVRAQALLADGRLVDDFLMVEGPHALNVCNAPSPAATASLEIGKAIAERVTAA
jgi:(S)-2-hydroxyglutarate dehydrogenase